MRKLSSVLIVLLFMFGSQRHLQSATLAGVSMSESAQVAGKTLVLNGMGLRTKFVVKVYVAGLYLQQKTSDPNAILKSDAAKRLVMHFMRDVSKKQLTDAFTESFNNNSPDAKNKMKADLDQFLAAMETVKEGDEMAFTYTPGEGTNVTVNNNQRVTIANPAFSTVLFSVWLGPKPPNADLKKGILGQ